MQKNWYIIYTKAKCQKKVASLLTKKKIENFFPLHWKETTFFGKRKIYQEPLLESYVFAHIDESETEKIKAINGVVNLLYWKGRPAVINQEEIAVMKEFITSYRNIRVDKAPVNMKDTARALDGSKYSFTGNVLTIKNTMAKVNLPSLGFTLVAKVETADSLQSSAIFGKTKLLFQS
jgi:transcription antitermination factor NusG